MNTLSQVAIFLIQSFASIYLFILILRFLLQIARADFYNPISQFVVKATNPLLLPARKIIPGFWGLDIASLVIAILFHIAIFYIQLLVVQAGIISPLPVFVWTLFAIAIFILRVYLISMLIVAISSFIAPYSGHPILLLLRQLIEPVVRPFRRLIPPTGGFDLSFMVASIILVAVNMLLLGFLSSVGVGGYYGLLLIPMRFLFG